MAVPLVIVKEFVSHANQDYFIIPQQQNVNKHVLPIFLPTIKQIDVKIVILHVFHVISVNHV